MPSRLARTATPHTRSPPPPSTARHVFLGSRLRLRLPSHPPHGVAVAIDLWLVPSTSTGDSHPRSAGHAGRTRVGPAIAGRPPRRSQRAELPQGRSPVRGHGVVVAVPADDAGEPAPLFGDREMLASAQLGFDLA